MLTNPYIIPVNHYLQITTSHCYIGSNGNDGTNWQETEYPILSLYFFLFHDSRKAGDIKTIITSKHDHDLDPSTTWREWPRETDKFDRPINRNHTRKPTCLWPDSRLLPPRHSSKLFIKKLWTLELIMKLISTYMTSYFLGCNHLIALSYSYLFSTAS